MPAADEEDRHLVGDDVRQHRGRPQRVPKWSVEGGIAAGHGVGDQRPEVAALIASALAHPGNAAGPWPRMLAAVDHLQRRVDDVEQPVDPAVGPHGAQVRHAAHRRRVAVEVARGHHREDRLERRVRPDRGRGEQLVDRQVGHPEHADAPVGVGQLGRPVDQLHSVLRLPRAEHLEGTARDAATPDVDHHLDVAAFDQIREWRRRRSGRPAAAPSCRTGSSTAARGTAPRRAGPVLGLGGVMNVDPQVDAVAHRHRDVVTNAHAVLRRPGRPRRRNGDGLVSRTRRALAIAALASPPPARMMPGQTVKIR